MRTLNAILEGGFEAHARALPVGGGFAGGRSRAVLRSIHRRRTTRAAATAGGSLLAVGAVSVGAIAVNARGAVQPGLTPPITNGLYPWCDLTTYPAVNPDAYGASPYLGRFYEDYANDVYVFVAADGSRQTPERDSTGSYGVRLSDGTFLYEGRGEDDGPEWMPLRVADMFTLEFGYARNVSGRNDDPGLAYEWTTMVPGDVPNGVDVVALTSVLVGYFGLAVPPDMEAAVPNGAIVEMIVRKVDGSEDRFPASSRRAWLEDPADSNFTDLASVSVRVSNLPDGGVFEITSTYDPSKTWQVACWPYRDGASATASPGTSPSVEPMPTPSSSGWASPSSSPGPSQGGFDAGPTPSPSYVTPSPSTSSSAPSPTP